MTPNSVFEEIWRIKDELADEAGGDLRRMCENTRRWAAEHPHTGPTVKSADDLRRFMEEQAAAELILHQDPANYNTKKD